MDVKHKKHLSIQTYVIIWLALLALTLLSFLLSLAHLGAADTVAALAIAAVKTTLVLLFFMHLIEQRIANALVILTAVTLVVLLIWLMVADVVTRQTFPRAPVPAVAPI